MPLTWFIDIPAEIRVSVYSEFFASMEVQYNSNRRVYPKEETNTAPMNLLLSAKQIKEEAEPIFWHTVDFFYKYHGRPMGNDCRYTHVLPPSHHQDRFNKIQSLTVHGDLTPEDLEELTRMLLGSADASSPRKHTRYLSVESELDLTYGYDQIINIISQARNRLTHLELSLDFFAEFEGMHQASLIQPSPYRFPEDTICILTIKDTYDVDIDRWEGDFHPLLEGLLEETYGEDYAKLKLAWKPNDRGA